MFRRVFHACPMPCAGRHAGVDRKTTWVREDHRATLFGVGVLLIRAIRKIAFRRPSGPGPARESGLTMAPAMLYASCTGMKIVKMRA